MLLKKKLFILLGIILVSAAIFAAALPSILKSQGLHPDYDGPSYEVPNRRALIVTTSHGVLNKPGETIKQRGKVNALYLVN